MERSPPPLSFLALSLKQVSVQRFRLYVVVGLLHMVPAVRRVSFVPRLIGHYILVSLIVGMVMGSPLAEMTVKSASVRLPPVHFI